MIDETIAVVEEWVVVLATFGDPRLLISFTTVHTATMDIMDNRNNKDGIQRKWAFSNQFFLIYLETVM